MFLEGFIEIAKARKATKIPDRFEDNKTQFQFPDDHLSVCGTLVSAVTIAHG